jgi:hypothetical protein
MKKKISPSGFVCSCPLSYQPKKKHENINNKVMGGGGGGRAQILAEEFDAPPVNLG